MAEPQQQQPQPEPRQPPRPTQEIFGPESTIEAARSLGELAVNQELTIRQEAGLFGTIVTAQPIAKYRDAAKILRDIDVWAGIAGKRWFYRFPVRNRKTGQTDYIEGPSVKCTNAVARLYGNCNLESRTMRLDETQYICYSRFADWETGFSITKGQLVPRSATLGGEDEERRVAIAHNIGQSKSQRNVTDAAIGDFTQRAFEAAKRSIVEKIGRHLERSRTRIVELLNDLGHDKGIPNIVARVERVKARKVAEWLAPDIAGIHGELESILDGYASIDEQWPLAAPPEPRRGDAESPAAASPPPENGAAAGAAAPSTPPPAYPAGGSAPPSSNPPPAETSGVADAEPGARAEGPATLAASAPPLPDHEVRKPASADVAGERTAGATIGTSPPPPRQSAAHAVPDAVAEERNWRVPPDIIGQDNIIRALEDLLDMTESEADQDTFERQNAERIAKITGIKGQQLRAKFAAKRKARGGGRA